MEQAVYTAEDLPAAYIVLAGFPAFADHIQVQLHLLQDAFQRLLRTEAEEPADWETADWETAAVRAADRSSFVQHDRS